jgi:hypothetical protein
VVEDIGTGPRDGSCRAVHGIYASVPGSTIVNNVVDRAVGDGISSWHAARALTIANNLSMRNGGHGVLIGSGDTGATSTGHVDSLVSNNILAQNALFGLASSSDGSHPVGRGNRYLNNLTFGNGRGSLALSVSDGHVSADNRDGDPQFVDRAPGASRDYRLRMTSPAVDAGTCAGAPRRAYGGAPRFQGRAVDIGPTERRSSRRRC